LDDPQAAVTVTASRRMTRSDTDMMSLLQFRR
jgi:hypothetical protein